MKILCGKAQIKLETRHESPQPLLSRQDRLEIHEKKFKIFHTIEKSVWERDFCFSSCKWNFCSCFSFHKNRSSKFYFYRVSSKKYLPNFSIHDLGGISSAFVQNRTPGNLHFFEPTSTSLFFKRVPLSPTKMSSISIRIYLLRETLNRPRLQKITLNI